MKLLLTFLFLYVILLSCKKEQTVAMQSCYKGRFVAEGCWPVIEVLEPFNESLPTAHYEAYEHTVGTETLPEKYKDGKPFYFTVGKIDSNKTYLTYCLPTKYFVELNNLSESSCEERGN